MEVNIAEILRSKSPKLYRWTPRFAIGYLRRIIHEDEINYCLRNFAHLPPVEFIRATLNYMGISYRAVGMENIPRNGRYIFASNHPFGGMDGMMLADEVSRHMGDVRVVVNDLLMNLAPLAPIFIPVNKHGRQNTKHTEMYNEAFESDLPIITFPAGLCSRKIKGVVTDLPWKNSFVKKAIATGRDIIPVYCEGRLSNFFYRLYSLRKTVGIKTNIEMLYLADEMFRQKGRHFDIYIGKPISYEVLRHNGRTPSQITEEVRTKAYNLKKMNEI